MPSSPLGGPGSLLPPGTGRRHAHSDGGRLGEPGAGGGEHHQPGAGGDRARAGGRTAGRTWAALLQGKEGHPHAGRGAAGSSQQHRDTALRLLGIGWRDVCVCGGDRRGASETWSHSDCKRQFLAFFFYFFLTKTDASQNIDQCLSV